MQFEGSNGSMLLFSCLEGAAPLYKSCRSVIAVGKFLLLPTKTILKMTTVLEENVHNFAVDGSSDDLDVPIKVRISCKSENYHHDFIKQ